MSDPSNEIERYLADAEHCAGRRPSHFLCPILLEESPQVELIDGHILPQALRTASRATVLQRKDVDNFFGSKIEPALIEFVNSVTLTKSEFLERADGINIVSENAGPLELFVPNRKSTPPFPKIGLKDSKGNVIGSPHVKGSLDALGGSSGTAEVRGRMSFHKPSIDGAILKSAHLALFRLAGYRWALSPAGQYTSDPLRRFVRSDGEEKDAEAAFAGFANAFHVILSSAFPFDTLRDSTIILHDHLNDPKSVAPFGISCVFSVNERTLLVTVPFCGSDANFASCIEQYEALMSNWHTPHRMIRAIISRDGIECQSLIQMQYTDSPPPELIPPNRSDID